MVQCIRICQTRTKKGACFEYSPTPLAMMIRKNVDPASLLLPSVNTKDIEFVIPPTRPPPSKSAQCLYIRNNNNNNVNCTKSTTRLNSTTSEESQSTPPKLSVNKGWNFIQDVMAESQSTPPKLSVNRGWNFIQ